MHAQIHGRVRTMGHFAGAQPKLLPLPSWQASQSALHLHEHHFVTACMHHPSTRRYHLQQKTEWKQAQLPGLPDWSEGGAVTTGAMVLRPA